MWAPGFLGPHLFTEWTLEFCWLDDRLKATIGVVTSWEQPGSPKELHGPVNVMCQAQPTLRALCWLFPLPRVGLFQTTVLPAPFLQDVPCLWQRP